MQQQSQIFVFSTSLANKAADAVHHGQCKTIIDYHMEQPGTKQFLQVGVAIWLEQPAAGSCLGPTRSQKAQQWSPGLFY